MTVGAALLDWVQPARTDQHRPAIELIARGNSAPQTWAAVQVAPQRPTGRPQPMHFFIDRDGNCSPTDHWLAQRRLGSDPVVRVGLQASTYSNEITDPQWRATQELIAALQRTCKIARQRVIIDDTLDLPAASVAARSPHPRS